jgi:predicted component of type VI protein secretion system
MADLARLLPGGDLHALLMQAGAAMMPGHLDWHARVEIDETAIAPARIGGARLGLTSWIAPRGRRRTRRDVRLAGRAGTEQQMGKGAA